MSMFFVTGATGNIGRPLVAGLRQRGGRVRALTRRTELRFRDGVEAVVGDLTADPDAVYRHLDGITGLFLNADATAGATQDLLQAARRTGVEHVVTISSVYVVDGRTSGQQPDAIAAMHRATEELVEASGLSWTHLRAEEFAVNDLRQFLPQLAYGDTVYGAHPDAGTPTVHEADLAEVAAQVLTDGPQIHGGVTFELTGPQTLTEADRVKAIGSLLERPLRYEQVSTDQARRGMLSGGLPAPLVDAVLSKLTARTDNPAPPHDAIKRILGRSAASYERWLYDHADDFTS